MEISSEIIVDNSMNPNQNDSVSFNSHYEPNFNSSSINVAISDSKNDSVDASMISKIDNSSLSIRDKMKLFDKSGSSTPAKFHLATTPSTVVLNPSPTEILLKSIDDYKKEIASEKENALIKQTNIKKNVRKILNESKCWSILSNTETNSRCNQSNSPIETIWSNIEQFLYGDSNVSTINLKRVSLNEQEAVLDQVSNAIQKKKDTIKNLEGKIEDLVCIKIAMLERIRNRKIFGLIKSKDIACCLPFINDPLILSFEDPSSSHHNIKQAGKTTPIGLLQDLKRIRDDLHIVKTRMNEIKKENDSLTALLNSGKMIAAI